MMTYKLRRMAKKINKINYNKPSHTKLAVKMKFYMVRCYKEVLTRAIQNIQIINIGIIVVGLRK